ncbi:Uma2 family endonuclease [Candidatus Thiothrix sp. Deng01]|uniref:Uma2 family endonuclease n=1 Tax=Candidatus Thiothrix phosphatis TaxID=3112415 RepID=A0ABU6D3D1_9GAMM|nr:Uma2 family endonuclease [Candidatus Thiothrix sp. Deng01]MEB4593591.1 Uma2 family endonuclease [Candidatus Thiothrix sp. Deng01]
MQFQFSQLTFPQDTEVIIHDVSWEEFERFMDELGDRSSLRIHYNHEAIYLMAPSAGHEVPKIHIGRFIEYLLEQQDAAFESLGSVTLRKQAAKKAAEADECFYIEHEAAVRGKDKISLDVDPPPDLAVEIDIYSPTDRELYAALGVPELWIYDGRRLEILVLRDGGYQPLEYSPHFPGLDLRSHIPAFIALGKRDGRMAAMKAFRQWADENPVARHTVE